MPAATYPGGIWSPTTKTDKVDLVQAEHMNAAQREIKAVQTELGIDVAGSKANLLTRLAVLMTVAGAVAQGTGFPAGPIEGQLFYRTDEDTPYIYDGAAWDSLLAVADNAITNAKMADDAIHQVELYTTTGEVNSIYNNSARFWVVGHQDTQGAAYSNVVTRCIQDGNDEGSLTLAGGEYGFYPQSKYTGGRMYFNTRYVQSSGKEHWIFLLYDKVEKKILSGYSAPDHPCYGQGAEEDKIPHPFADYWDKSLPANLEIILLDNDKLNEIKAKVTRNRGILEIIQEEYEIDELSTPIYEPREIIEIDEFGDRKGEVIKTYKNKTRYGKTKTLKRRMVATLPPYIKYRSLKLK